MIFTFLHYFIFSSAVLIYGIGINNSTILCDSYYVMRLNFVKIVLSILSTTAITWIVIKQFLVPLRITELYPLVALLVFMAVSIFLETIIRITMRKTTSDFNFSFLIVILSLNESVHITDVVLISVASVMSFFTLLPLLNAIKVKLDVLGPMERHCSKKALMVISLSIIVILISAGNISWLNPGVIK